MSFITRPTYLIALCCLLCFPVTSWAAEEEQADKKQAELAVPKIDVPRTGQYSTYGEDGVRIDHVGTGQDGEIQAGAVWPAQRFIDNGDGTITDKLTGLMWLQDGSCLGALSWQAAVDVVDDIQQVESSEKCIGLSAYNDWILPDIGQLETLLNAEESRASKWLNKYRFRNVQPAGYWSYTSGPNPYSAWTLRFDTGNVEKASKVESRFCLLVRGGVPMDDDELAVAKGWLRYPRLWKMPSDKKVDESGSGESEEPAILPAEQDGKSAAPERFVENGDGTFTDKATGLMWLIDASCLGSQPWLVALDTVDNFNGSPASFSCGGAQYSDWALPNRIELRSLIYHQADLPALPTDHPFTNLQPGYWTSTTSASQAAMAYEMYLGSGELQAQNKIRASGIMPVRPAGGRPERDRYIGEQGSTIEEVDYFSLLPIGNEIDLAWPIKRFTDHGDGTVTDNISGLMWLKDGDCFLPESWQNANVVVTWLSDAEKSPRLNCREYTATYGDWHLPDMEMISDFIQSAKGELSTWLNSQGVFDIAARDYWISVDNPLNLYHAWGVNMRTGTPRNYPKSFELHVWPYRWPYVLDAVNPVPKMFANGESDVAFVKQGKELALSVSIDNVDAAVPTSCKIWYEAPDNKNRWLTGQGEWVTEEVAMFTGKLFQLDESPIFVADTAELPTGKYSFSFAILPEAKPEAQQLVFTTALEVNITEAEDAEDGVAGPGQDESKGYTQEVLDE